MAALQQRSGGTPLPVIPLIAEISRIGRQPDCEVFLDSQDVSRYHARIFRDRGQFVIDDLQSRNGTQVNGKTVTSSLALEDGDEITISSLRFAFLSQDPLLYDSSPSGYTPSVITFSDGSVSGLASRKSGTAGGKPLTVIQGDRIPIEVFGDHKLNSHDVISRVSVGKPDDGWPTIKLPEEKLFSVLRLHHQMRGTVPQSDVLSSAIEGLFDAFDAAERIVVILRSAEGTGLVVAAASSHNPGDEIRISIPLLYTVMETGESLLCVEQEPGPDTSEVRPKDFDVRYLLASTLIGADHTARGAVQIETRRSGGFEPIQAEHLAILSHVISCRLDDAAAANAVTGTAVLNQSTQMAERLRRQLAPVKLPRVDGFRVRHQVLTVPTVAADLVDYVRLSDGRLACFALDVPGRGCQAAGLMAAIARLVTRGLAVPVSPADTIQAVEDELKTRMGEIPVITSLCIAILDPERSTVTVSTAGHCPAYHFSGRTVEPLAAEHMTGPALGLSCEGYQDSELYLEDDDVLLLCSDGIARIPLEDGTLASGSEIGRLLERADSAPRTELEDRVMLELQKLKGTSALLDDIVLLAIHKTDAPMLDSDVFRSRDTQVHR